MDLDPETLQGGVPEEMKGLFLLVVPYEERFLDETGYKLNPAVVGILHETKEKHVKWTHRMRNNNLFLLFGFQFEADRLYFQMAIT